MVLKYETIEEITNCLVKSALPIFSIVLVKTAFVRKDKQG